MSFYQVWDMSTATLYTSQDEAWQAIDLEGCYSPDTYKALVVAWYDFCGMGVVGDIYRLNSSVYVVKLGKDWSY